MTVQAHQRLTAALPDCTLEPLGEGLIRLRQIKDQDETDSLRQAQRIAEEAFDALLGVIRPGMTEKELAALLEYEMAKRGSERPSSDTILISGAKTSMPHGMPDEKPVAAGEFILVDFGAVVNGYHSDMTRTFALGSVTERMRTVYDTVLAAQETGIRMLRAGVSCDQPHLAAHQIIRDAGFGECFGHALGHCVGLEIHESPALSPRGRQTLEAGMAITVEPGIYLPGEFGVRIADPAGGGGESDPYPEGAADSLRNAKSGMHEAFRFCFRKIRISMQHPATSSRLQPSGSRQCLHLQPGCPPCRIPLQHRSCCGRWSS